MSGIAEDVATYISKLAGPNPTERQAAAFELFRLGCARAEPVLRKWFADPEFRALAGGKAGGLLTVGIAVRPSTFEAIRTSFGQPKLAEVPADQDALEFELAFAHGVRLDVITPRTSRQEGAIARFLARFGEGIQQIECRVRDASSATEILRRRFVLEPIYPQIREGADRTRVNFFLVPLEDGSRLLVELVESPKTAKKG